jgi:hypothetical protein
VGSWSDARRVLSYLSTGTPGSNPDLNMQTHVYHSGRECVTAPPTYMESFHVTKKKLRGTGKSRICWKHVARLIYSYLNARINQYKLCDFHCGGKGDFGILDCGSM